MQVTSGSKTRRYVMQGALLTGLVTTAGFGIAWSLPGDALTDPGMSTSPTQGQGDLRETLDPDTYLGVQRLRDELCLGRSDLASMGCDTATARLLLERLITTHETRRADVIAARNNVLSTKTALYRAQREGSGGPPDGLRQLATDYDNAVEAYHDLLDSIASRMTAGLTADQGALWQAARSSQRHGLPPGLRYAVDMTPGQLEDMRNPGSDAQGRPRSPVEAADLRLTQEASIEQARANRTAHAAGVVLAEEEALPVPPDLIDDEAGVVDDEAEEE